MGVAFVSLHIVALGFAQAGQIAGMRGLAKPVAQRFFAGVAERRVAQIVREASHLHHGADVARRAAQRQKFARLHHHAHAVAQAAADTGHFHAVGEAVVGVVVLGKGMHLGFAPQAAERAGKHHAVVIDMKIGAQGIGTLLRGRRAGGHDFAVFGAEALGAEQLLPVHFGAHGRGFFHVKKAV